MRKYGLRVRLRYLFKDKHLVSGRVETKVQSADTEVWYVNCYDKVAFEDGDILWGLLSLE